MHRGEYGLPDQDLIVDENQLDGGGNNGQGNFDLGDQVITQTIIKII